jgi:hypothetical protein
MIKKFKDYILENYIAEPTDAPEIASDKNQFNNIQKQVEEYNKKKTIVTNIYLSYVNEVDLINKLSGQKLIDRTADKKSIKFYNPIIGLWAQSCQKQREVKDIKAEIEKLKGNIKDEETNIKMNPSSKESIQSTIDLINDKIKLKGTEINDKLSEINNLEKTTKDKIKSYVNDINTSKKRIDGNSINKL